MKLLFVETWGIGDVLQMLPAIEGIRHHVLPTERHLLIKERALHSLLSPELIDRVIYQKGRGKWGLIRSLWKLRNENYDGVVFNNELSIFIRIFSNLIFRPSFIVGANRRPFGTKLREKHQLEETVGALKNWFRDLKPKAICTPVAKEEDAWAEAFLKSQNLVPGKFVAVHPGSMKHQTYKRLSGSYVKALVTELQGAGRDVLLVVGPDDPVNWPGLSVLINESLERVAAVLQKASCTIAGNTGIGHLSALVKTPVVTVAGSTAIQRTKPWGEKNIVVQRSKPLPCQPCNGRGWKIICFENKCITGVEFGRVLSAVQQLN